MIPVKKQRENILKEFEGMSDKQIINIIKVIRIFKESVKNENDLGLQQEFQDWDNLSDEALLDFEKTL